MADGPGGAHDECFPDAAWLDYARGLTGGDETKRMQTHLADGCIVCGARLAIWTQASDIAQKEGQYTPSDQLVASVKNAFDVSRRLPFLDRLAAAAQLIFDTSLSPAPAGIRGVAVPTRHVVHQSGDIVIDLKLDDEGAFIALTGQVLFQDAVSGQIAGTRVFLTRGHAFLVTQTMVNDTGEFHFDFEPEPGLKVYFELPAGELISTTLPSKEA